MNNFDQVQAFIERCNRSATVDELTAAFWRTLDALGFRYFACCSHVDPVLPPRRAVMLINYPPPWIQEFSERQLYDIDPIFRQADVQLLPFSWDNSRFRAGLSRPQRAILEDASRFGIQHGYTIPIHLPGSQGRVQGSCSVVPDSLSVAGCHYQQAQLMAYYIFEIARQDALRRHPRPRGTQISRREQQCLELAALGKTDWEISKLLGLAQSTVHNHIATAIRRLGSTNRTQAVVHALITQEISFGDVIRSEITRQPPRTTKRRVKRKG